MSLFMAVESRLGVIHKQILGIFKSLTLRGLFYLIRHMNLQWSFNPPPPLPPQQSTWLMYNPHHTCSMNMRGVKGVKHDNPGLKPRCKNRPKMYPANLTKIYILVFHLFRNSKAEKKQEKELEIFSNTT